VVHRVADVGRDDDLVARAHLEGTQRELERGAPGADGRRRGYTEPLRELALESGDLGPLRELASADDARDALGVVVAESRPRVRDYALGLTDSGAIGPTGRPLRT
jgi:hypothetical protein